MSLLFSEGTAEQWEMFNRHYLTGSQRLARTECSVLDIWYLSCSAAQWGGASPQLPSWVSQGTFSISPVVQGRADSVLLIEPDGSYPQPVVLLVAFCRSYRIEHEGYCCLFTINCLVQGRNISVLAVVSPGVLCPIWGVILPIIQLSREPSKQSGDMKLHF